MNDTTKKSQPNEQAAEVQSSTKKIQEATGGSLEYPSHEALEKQLSDIEAKADEYYKNWLRAQAELENVRKRSETEINRAKRYGTDKLAQELLPILDSLEQGLKNDVAENELAQTCQEGIQLTLNMMLATLEKFGVKPLDALDKPFNPEFHEAMSTQPKEGIEPNVVIEVLQKGYVLHERLLRPALVVVSK